jgi:hypothetical protein
MENVFISLKKKFGKDFTKIDSHVSFVPDVFSFVVCYIICYDHKVKLTLID